MKKSIVIIIVLVVIICSICIYLNTYYKADSEVNDYLESNTINVSKIDNTYFFDGPGEENTIIFYPGGKVEYTSYAPLLYKLAENGIDTFLLQMPFNLAILDTDAANKIINDYEYDNYYLMGHSLGGVAISMHKFNNIDGIIFLASYPTKKINDNISVLSIYGTNDGVLDMDKYNKSKKYWSKYTIEKVINGANHSQFGNYGDQKGDNPATITRKKQQYKTIETIIDFINNM